MRVTQLSEHIYSLGTWFIIPFHVWVVVEKDGVVLVDAGLPTMRKGILSLIDKLGKGPLTKILLTHGHSDHVGSIKGILADRKVPVYAHDIEKPLIEGKVGYPGRKPRAFLPSGIVQPLERSGDAIAMVGSLKPYLTPGHAPGHVVYHHQEDNILLAADLFWEKNGRLEIPRFSYNIPLVVESGRIVTQLRPKQLEVCHGYTVRNPAEQYDGYVRDFRNSKAGALVTTAGRAAADAPSMQGRS